MANGFYDKGVQSFMIKQIDMNGDNIKVALVKTGAGHYVANLATDQFLAIINSSDIIARTANLAGKTTTAGVFGASNTVFTAVAAGPAAGAIVVYQDTGADATSRLIVYIDGYSGLPVTPNGGDINVTWPTDANLIFKL